jgi:hypothetical protein
VVDLLPHYQGFLAYIKQATDAGHLSLLPCVHGGLLHTCILAFPTDSYKPNCVMDGSAAASYNIVLYYIILYYIIM